MTQKQYEKFAVEFGTVLKQHRVAGESADSMRMWDKMVSAFCKMALLDNPNFSPLKFRDAAIDFADGYSVQGIALLGQ